MHNIIAVELLARCVVMLESSVRAELGWINRV